MNFAFWKKEKPKPTRQLIAFRGNGLNVRLVQWKSDRGLVSDAMAIVGDARFQRMLECLRTESPGNFALTNADLPTRAHWQSKTEGYNLAINNLLALAMFSEPEVEPQETWERPGTEEQPTEDR